MSVDLKTFDRLITNPLIDMSINPTFFAFAFFALLHPFNHAPPFFKPLRGHQDGLPRYAARSGVLWSCYFEAPVWCVTAERGILTPPVND